MDFDKLLKWRELANRYYGKDFWSEIFDGNGGQDFMSDLVEPLRSKESFPNNDIYLNDNEVVVIFEIPGVDKEDIKLNLTGENLKISGQVRKRYENYERISEENFYGKFEKTVKLPYPVKGDGISAACSNGILEVRLALLREHSEAYIKID